MTGSGIRTKFAFLLCIVFMSGAQAAPAERVWITLGQPAYELLRVVDPDVQSVRRVELSNGLRDSRGDMATDTVHLVSVARDDLPALSRRVHKTLHHCGGYVAHDSLATALDALKPARQFGWLTTPSYEITQQALVIPMLAEVDAGEIESMVLLLSSFRNRFFYSTYGADAADWLVDAWTAMGAGRPDIHVRQVFRAGAGDTMPSVVLTIDGTDLPDQVVVLGAHLDSVNWYSGGDVSARFAPGADDDASGVAGLTEVLRVLLDNDFKPRRTIALMAYAGEEVGLYGSRYIAADYAARKVDVVGMLQLDMTLYKGSSADIYLIDDYTDAAQNQFLEALAATYLPTVTVDYFTCGYACSDHASWTRVGYPASFPYESRIDTGEDYPWIHTAGDTWVNADAPGPGTQADQAVKFTRLALAYTIELAGAGIGPIRCLWLRPCLDVPGPPRTDRRGRLDLSPTRATR